MGARHESALYASFTRTKTEFKKRNFQKTALQKRSQSAEPRADHAQYLASWLSVLKADKKAFSPPQLKASEAAAFLSGFQGA